MLHSEMQHTTTSPQPIFPLPLGICHCNTNHTYTCPAVSPCPLVDVPCTLSSALLPRHFSIDCISYVARTPINKAATTKQLCTRPWRGSHRRSWNSQSWFVANTDTGDEHGRTYTIRSTEACDLGRPSPAIIKKKTKTNLKGLLNDCKQLTESSSSKVCLLHCHLRHEKSGSIWLPWIMSEMSAQA